MGRVLAPWGARGEVRAQVLTQFPERFAALHEITVGEERRVFRLQSARLHKGNVVLKLEGIDSPEQAAALRGELLYVPLSEAMPLGEHEYYHYQILGLDVYTVQGEHLGSVTDILETGSNDVYVVQGRGREVLIPALADVVQEVDLEHRRLVVVLPPGLVDEEEA
ncbi:MAG: ribosome maturation factor RimM [Anaerolineae bacterium]|nr:ribosome maturation factor RimM [Anaerolineae bacterium]